MQPNRAGTALPTAVEAAISIVSFEKEDDMAATRAIPAEEPVNIVYAGIPFAVMMASPSDLEDFAVGFSLTEGIVETVSDIRSIRVEREPRGVKLLVDLSAERLHIHLARKRALAGRTGCGVCGIDDLDSLPVARRTFGNDGPVIPIASIRSALDTLELRQPLNAATHAVHAAAWADLNGNLVVVREDVGRHNALDKLIGALCRDTIAPDNGFCIVTSRCSFELVEKVAAFGGRAIVAISAPTSLAVDRARLHDMTLVAVARRDTMTVFHGRERIGILDALP
ncbi:formate dehydrogenase accessory sulfurtransferase FdhD [Microvirga puerhi]|uniref:Sulfur carrier protein FdhD n=1 Tax=Microvirga puerhi TaxID=2876078 RepID=A0ABS7VS92_9HYPH|nr:formate dehydrogenase accessory sulfurtransferase FdhD [Microvirga puerhi]MBZ6078389.1 formate dehydrogenase accessory sulfurtransferase FdhD [Microvirga puerhi]